MHMSTAERGRPDLQALKHLALECGTEALQAFDAILPGGYFQFVQARDTELFVKREDFVGTQPRD